MPITGPSSYVTTVPLFINHWNDVNAAGTPVVLDMAQTGQPTPVTVGILEDLYGELTDARARVEVVMLDLALQQAEVLQEKTWLQTQVTAFNRNVRADHGASPFAKVLPVAPGVENGRERFNAPLRLVVALWGKVNAWRAAQTPVIPPLTLPGEAGGGAPVTLAVFSSRSIVLAAAMDVAEEREQQATLERAERNELQGRIYPILKVYRLKIAAVFAPGSPFVETLPALSEEAGATPQPGTLTGHYDVAQEAAVLAGTPSPSASVVRHQIRASVGEEPQVDDEVVRAEFEPGVPIALETTYGLAAPGETVNFRLVAITADGHERGTEWVRVQRPV